MKTIGIIGILVAGIFFILLVNKSYRKIWITPKNKFPENWRKILNRYVNFYEKLSKKKKKHFEFKVQEFLSNCKITGGDTEIDDTDRVLVAASAIIPVFAFPEWKYTNVDEIIIYPGSFTEEFDTAGKGRNITGMVGTGYLNRKMILSQAAIKQGFLNETDKQNTTIHEFIHLIDKADGVVDGIPEVLMEKQYVIPWLDMMEKEIQRIVKGKSDINPYAITNRQEFFAVVGEYFFEKPALLKKKHPELYQLLEEVFS